MLAEAAPRWADSADHGYGRCNLVHRLVLKSPVGSEKADGARWVRKEQSQEPVFSVV